MQGVEAIIRVLDDVDRLIDATPPVDNAGSRFGNPAFRSFYDKIHEARLPSHFLVMPQLVLILLSLVLARLACTRLTIARAVVSRKFAWPATGHCA